MATINLQPALMKQLEALAVEHTTTTEEVLESAVRAYLREIDRKQIKTESAAFAAMHEALVKTYLGQHVAMHHGEVVDHDPDFQTLHAHTTTLWSPTGADSARRGSGRT
ncbi:MAG: hypothetical protein R2911_05415 [Caldilineaceae bacterium]